MTELQHKINVVEQYLYAKGKRDKTGKPIKIVFKQGDNTIELQKLKHAYHTAIAYFNNI